jgi:hypothetical protein
MMMCPDGCFRSGCLKGASKSEFLSFGVGTIHSGLHEKKGYRRLFHSYVASTVRFANRNSLGMAPPLDVALSPGEISDKTWRRWPPLPRSVLDLLGYLKYSIAAK